MMTDIDLLEIAYADHIRNLSLTDLREVVSEKTLTAAEHGPVMVAAQECYRKIQEARALGVQGAHGDGSFYHPV